MSILKKGFFTNRLIIIGIVVELALLAILLYVPFFNKVFNTAPIGLVEWGFLIIWAPIILILDEIRKMILRNRDKKKFNMVIESARR
jgi:magnesium-transporting ATPase (P-type)